MDNQHNKEFHYGMQIMFRFLAGTGCTVGTHSDSAKSDGNTTLYAVTSSGSYSHVCPNEFLVGKWDKWDTPPENAESLGGKLEDLATNGFDLRPAEVKRLPFGYSVSEHEFRSVSIRTEFFKTLLHNPLFQDVLAVMESISPTRNSRNAAYLTQVGGLPVTAETQLAAMLTHQNILSTVLRLSEDLNSNTEPKSSRGGKTLRHAANI